MTLAPLSAKCRPIARPMPLAPPVTIAVFPDIENDIGVSPVAGLWRGVS